MVETPQPTETAGGARPVWQRGKPDEILDANRPLIKQVSRLIKQRQRADVLDLLCDWPAADVMELLIRLPLKQARKLYEWLPADLASRVLIEISPALRPLLLEDAGVKRTAAILEALEDDDAVELLLDLSQARVKKLLPRLPRGDALRERLAFGEDSAGSIMSNRFIAVLDDWDIDTAIREIRRLAPRIEKLYEIYVVDRERRLIGRVKLRDLLLHARKTAIRDIMRKVRTTVLTDTDQERVLELAERYKLQTVPVVNAEGRIVGRITLDELRDVVREETDEDIKLMGGVAATAQPDETILKLVKGRLPWLVAGLFGASMAATIVGSFEEELERAVILASFIPVVMAMAGNAGIQASTVTVQGLAGGNIWKGDLVSRLFKELAGALINGLSVAVLLALLVAIGAQIVAIQAPGRLALATGLSVTAVTIIAAAIGSTIPLLLQRLKIDPAVATGVFITSSNDILGVLIYFTIATAIYLDGIGPL